MMMKKMYYVSWNDWNGGQYFRSFKTKEEKEKFIERIVRTDKRVIRIIKRGKARAKHEKEGIWI